MKMNIKMVKFKSGSNREMLMIEVFLMIIKNNWVFKLRNLSLCTISRSSKHASRKIYMSVKYSKIILRSRATRKTF